MILIISVRAIIETLDERLIHWSESVSTVTMVNYWHLNLKIGIEKLDL